jgi:predicted nucleic acid binding AN1-type Zn finger protein
MKTQMRPKSQSQNAPMLKIARRASATLERDGSETQALLKVPKGKLKTRIAEWITDQYAQISTTNKRHGLCFTPD